MRHCSPSKPSTRYSPSVESRPPCSGASRRPAARAGLRPDLDPPCARQHPGGVGTRGVPRSQVRRASGGSNTGLEWGVYFFWESAEPAADLLSLDVRPSLSVFDAFDAAELEVFFVFVGSFCDRAEPAADLLFAPVAEPLRVFEAEVAALDEVVLPDISYSPVSLPSNASRSSVFPPCSLLCERERDAIYPRPFVGRVGCASAPSHGEGSWYRPEVRGGVRSSGEEGGGRKPAHREAVGGLPPVRGSAVVGVVARLEGAPPVG